MKHMSPSMRLILTLTVITVLAAFLHLNSRPAVAENTLLVRVADSETVVDLSALTLVRVQGETVNGKGEVRSIDADGIALKDLLIHVGTDTEALESVTVTAKDEYSATVTGEELNTADKVFLILRDDDSIQLVVFGDGNSRRNVRDVVLVECGETDR